MQTANRVNYFVNQFTLARMLIPRCNHRFLLVMVCLVAVSCATESTAPPLSEKAITVVREGSCYKCPRYTLVILASGEAQFTGVDNVRYIGSSTGHIEAASRLRIDKAVDEVKGRVKADQYIIENLVDAEIITVRLSMHDGSTRIIRFQNSLSGSSITALRELVKTTEEAVRASGWIR